jgi:hypothetical protein
MNRKERSRCGGWFRPAPAIARFGISALASWILAFHPSTALSAGPEIFLQEEPESYLIIDKLQGFGLLPGLMTGDRGLEAREVSREAGNAVETGDPDVDGMVRFLRLGGEPDWDFRLRAGLGYSREGRVPPNAQGLPVLKDGDIRVGGFFRGAPADWMALQARGDYLVGTDGERIGRLEEASLRLGWAQATLEAGRFSLWWGPGRHGALLFTTNAEPLTGIRLRNPRPIPLGWWFRFLGLFQYDLFVARLEADRPIPHPTLAGMRLAVKPKPWLEIGVSRAIYMGGEGRSVTWSTIGDALTANKENEPNGPGNQLASFDVKVHLPLRRQPVVFYVEGGAEDHAIGWQPSKWAWLGGVFLPSIGDLKETDFRIEFADTYDSANGRGIWYRHAASNGGYAHSYRRQILGHHLGTDARDLFLETHYFFVPSSYLELNVDLTQRFWPGPAREDSRRISAGFVHWFSRNVRAEGRLAYERISNEGGISGNDSRETSIQAALAYQYR